MGLFQAIRALWHVNVASLHTDTDLGKHLCRTDPPKELTMYQSLSGNVATGLGRPGWGGKMRPIAHSNQVILFDWVVCLNNACNHCKLQLEEVTLAQGYREEHVQPCSSSTGNATRGSKISPKWSEVGDREADGQKTRQPQNPTKDPS